MAITTNSSTKVKADRRPTGQCGAILRLGEGTAFNKHRAPDRRDPPQGAARESRRIARARIRLDGGKGRTRGAVSPTVRWRSRSLAASYRQRQSGSLRPRRGHAVNALVGLLTRELENPGPSRRAGDQLGLTPQDNGRFRRGPLSNARLQRRGRPGLAPEFPVLSAVQQWIDRPPTHASFQAFAVYPAAVICQTTAKISFATPVAFARIAAAAGLPR